MVPPSVCMMKKTTMEHQGKLNQGKSRSVAAPDCIFRASDFPVIKTFLANRCCDNAERFLCNAFSRNEKMFKAAAAAEQSLRLCACGVVCRYAALWSGNVPYDENVLVKLRTVKRKEKLNSYRISTRGAEGKKSKHPKWLLMHSLKFLVT